MPNWFREFVTFIVSLCREWVVLLTGGGVAAVLVVWGSATGKPLPLHVGWIFLGLTLMLAAFFSWRKQWREAEKNFLQIGPAALMKLREGKTSPHANTMLMPYIGKRIKVTGSFIDVVEIMFGIKNVHLLCEEVSISALVPFWKARAFVPLPKGAVITLTGTITEINNLSINISSIEIVPNPSVPIPAMPLSSGVAV
jgi:hypothetical protein